MRKLLTLLLFFVTISSLQAQYRDQKSKEYFEKDLKDAPYIFEGVEVRVEQFWPETGTKLLSISIKITKILRGDANLRYGTVEVIQKIFSQTSREKGYRNAWKGDGRQVLVFAEPNTYAYEPSPTYKSDNKMRLQLYHKTGELRSPDELISSMNFKNENDFYKYLKKASPDLAIPSKDYEYKKGEDKGDILLDSTGYYLKKSRYDEHYKYLKNKLKKNKPTKGQTGGTKCINFKIANPNVMDSLNGKSYFEIDILVSSTVPRYLDNAMLHLQYDAGTTADDVFYPNSIAYNKVQITADPLFVKQTYETPYIRDNSLNVINMVLGTNLMLSQWDRTLIDTVPKKLFHLKFEINHYELKARSIKTAG